MAMQTLDKIEVFKKCVYAYQSVMNLKNYEIHVFPQEKELVRASFKVYEKGKLISVFYSTWWIDNVEDYREIERVAFHEVYESTLYKIKTELRRTFNEDYVNELIHSNVRLIENLYFDLIDKL